MLPPTICLNMIVRNEAPVIARCLASVLPFVDCSVIVDTGSTDGGGMACANCLHPKPGAVRKPPWRNSGENRNSHPRWPVGFRSDESGNKILGRLISDAAPD